MIKKIRYGLFWRLEQTENVKYWKCNELMKLESASERGDYLDFDSDVDPTIDYKIAHCVHHK